MQVPENFVLIKGGLYQMGSPESEAWRSADETQHPVTADQDSVIIDRVAQLADKYGVSMTEISLAWLLAKVTAPVVGATKLHHIVGAAKAVSLALTADELAFLEEPYVAHSLVGVMAQNTQAAAKETHVWSIGNQKI